MANETSLDWTFTMGPSLWKMAVRIQIESVVLISRRAQAYMEIPQALAHCKSPEDLLTEQVRFWQIAQRHYMQGFERAMTSVHLAPTPETTATPHPARPRDYMVVSETVPAPKETAKPQDAREQAVRVRRSA